MNKNHGLGAAGAVFIAAAGISAIAGSSAQGVVPKHYHVQLGATGVVADAAIEDKIYPVDGPGPAAPDALAIDALKIGQKADLTITQDDGPRGPHEALLYTLAPNETRDEALAKIEKRAQETATTTRRLTGGSIAFTEVLPGSTVTLNPGTDYILLCNIVPHFRLGMFATVNENGNHAGH